MSVYKLNISKVEREVILGWAEKTISGGHWGDGDAVTRDDCELLKKLGCFKCGCLNIDDLELDLISFWMDVASQGITDEEKSLEKKINKLK